MVGIFQFGTLFLVPSLVLVAMGCVSIVLYLALNQKSRAIRRLPKNLPIKVFDRTFNVFDPYPDQRKIINNYIELLIPIIYGFIFFSWVVVFQILQMGLISGLIIFIICISLLMIEEASEFHKNAKILVNAVKNGDSLGKGDLEALSLIKKFLPKLSSYYLLLAIAFFTSSLVVPYILNMLLLLLLNLLWVRLH